MEIRGKRAIVLGGAGLVGRAVCRLLVEEGIQGLMVTSLLDSEAEEFTSQLKNEYPGSQVDFQVFGGNLFVRSELKYFSRPEIFADEHNRRQFISDILEPLSPEILTHSSLYQLITTFKPHVLVDCINTATAVAYQDIFSVASDVFSTVKSENSETKNLKSEIELLLGSLYVPQLIRHVQIMQQSMKLAGCEMYLKVGTSGTGGMGLNIPYTHSEDKPSRMLLAKAAMAGAHTLLLFLMARTPDSPIIKEVKPTAAIAWKKIGFGPIKVRGRQLIMEDCLPENAFLLTGQLESTISMTDKITQLKIDGKPRLLEAPFIDTGENGLFSLGEFEALTDDGQMEFITPEEIAQTILWEITGRNTGSDIVNALDNATMGPTYRAGYLRKRALDTLRKLEKQEGVDSVAFEILGPPKLSKLLYEIYLLKEIYQSFEAISAESAEKLSASMLHWISTHQDVRSRILSIGIPILLPDGKNLLRGKLIKIPGGTHSFDITQQSIELWAHDGWVDLRVENMQKWKDRTARILDEIRSLPLQDTSSRITRNRDYWYHDKEEKDIHLGKVAAWIFIHEEKGERMKA
ncbi:MAG: short-chain dehydrogenase [Bacteroidetes bacterium]|nr:short-chain dehydrogenase [Bacteroidota bacterium]